MKIISVVARIKPKGKHKEEVFEILKTLHRRVHQKEKGKFLKYDLYQDVEDKHSYTFIEDWISKQALEVHEKEAHFLNAVNELEGKLEVLTINKIRKLL